MGEFFSPIDNQSKYAYNKFMSNKAGKIWGSTELILANSSLEFHRINFKKGGVVVKKRKTKKYKKGGAVVKKPVKKTRRKKK